MAELKPERLAAQLAAEPLRPAYLIAGPEALIVLEAADAVRAAAREAGITERTAALPTSEARRPGTDRAAGCRRSRHQRRIQKTLAPLVRDGCPVHAGRPPPLRL